MSHKHKKKLAYAALTRLEFLSSLNIHKSAVHRRHSKIMCTIGKKSRDVNIIEDMIRAGMDLTRVILRGNAYSYHGETIDIIRQAEQKYSEEIGRYVPVPIAIDIEGNRIRTGFLENDTIEMEVKKKDVVIIISDEEYRNKCTNEIIFINYNIRKNLKEGQIIILNYGRIVLEVSSIKDGFVECTATSSGVIQNNMAVQMPGYDFDLPLLTEKDKKDIQFVVSKDIQMIIFSGITNADDVTTAREYARELDKDIILVAKIENKKALDNFEKILAEADGIYFSRLLIAQTVPIKDIFLSQKCIVTKCNLANKPIIIASDLMKSMKKHLRPTRSEGSDAANCVLDGADCLVLSKETALGEHPVECVLTMAAVCKEAEAAIWRFSEFRDIIDREIPPIPVYKVAVMCAVQAALLMEAKAILIATTSGRSAFAMTKYRPPCPVIAITRKILTAKQLLLYKSLLPVVFDKEPILPWIRDLDARIQYGIKVAQEAGILKVSDCIIIVTGWTQRASFTNTVRVIHVPDSNQPLLS